MPILKNFLAVIVGFMCGSFTNMALVKLGPRVIPWPAGVDMTTPESFAASAHLLESRHFLFPFLAHAVGTFIGSLLAYALSGSYRAVFAFVIGVLFMAGGIAAAFMIPAPKWFIALDLVVAYIPMTCLAVLIGSRFKGPSTAATS